MSKVLDKYGETYFLEITPCPLFQVRLFTGGNLRVATAKFNISETKAELIDIVVENHVPTLSGWRWTILRKPTMVSYRGRGIGSALLIRSLSGLVKQGVKTVWGVAEHKGLKAFYQRIGFTFDEQTKNITIHL